MSIANRQSARNLARAGEDWTGFDLFSFQDQFGWKKNRRIREKSWKLESEASPNAELQQPCNIGNDARQSLDARAHQLCSVQASQRGTIVEICPFLPCFFMIFSFFRTWPFVPSAKGSATRMGLPVAVTAVASFMRTAVVPTTVAGQRASRGPAGVVCVRHWRPSPTKSSLGDGNNLNWMRMTKMNHFRVRMSKCSVSQAC